MLNPQRLFWSLYGHFVWDDQIQPWRGSQIQQIVQILQQRKVKPTELVLDAGCGTGNYATALAQAGFQVIGVDFAAGMLKRAEAKLTTDLHHQLSFEHADLNTRLNFSDNQFDHLINISVLQVTTDPKATLNEFHRVLKENGTLVLLHIPKSNVLARQIFKERVDNLRGRNVWKLMLILFKTLGERTNQVRRWSEEELEEIVVSSKFDIVATDRLGLPIVIVAQKATA